ncbi:MAG: SDR family NAD(P)-dependent oxidoreductase [Chloroflexi bacterium]|nr:SDR family NAD(P)-dependent oxidoreductase [Chloroflexota bacterium]
MNVLLTGAFGNVGRSALEELIRQGHTVRCFDLKTRANARAARKFKGQVEVMWGDLRRPEDVAAAVQGQDVVVHLAFIIPKLSATGVECESRPDWAHEINVGGTGHLIQAMEAQPKPPRLIFTSSCHVYGRTQHQRPPRTVHDPVQPIEHYSQHKIACERMVRESRLEWSIFRLAATLPITMILDAGMFDVPLNNRMEYVHRRDVGLAIANGVRSEDVWGKILLIGGGPRCQYVYREMTEQILGAMGLGMLPDEAFGTTPFPTDWLDTAESQRLLGYQQRDLGDYVRDLVERVGTRRHLIRLFRPLVRRWLLEKSSYLKEARKARADWRGKVAIISGASGGIGAATAEKLAQEGLKVVLVARRKDRLEDLAARIRKAGGEALVIAADLTDEQDRLRVVEEVRTVYGTADVLINSAGIGWYGFGAEMPWTLALQMMRINMAAVVHLTLLFLQDVKERNSGHIINVGSIAGSLPSQGVAVYSATKSFTDTFTTSLYRELRGSNVHVSVVKPGPVSTEFYDVASSLSAGLRMPAEKFAVKPEAVANRIWTLLRKPVRIVYVPRLLGLVPWVELYLGWLMDLLGPLLLRRQLKPARGSVEV